MASQLRARHWIGGEWTDAPDLVESIDPANGELIGAYTEATGAMAKGAIAVARTAFRDTDWRDDRRLRARALNEMADRFEARTGDLVEILMLENGKIRAEAEFEVTMVPSKLRFYAALALADYGRAMETAPGRYTTTLREPVGVAGIIAPWNSPVVLFVRALAPALAAGCTAVGKLPGLTAQTNTGLAASVWSTNVDRPLRIARQLQAGTVWINNWAIVYDETEEGGYKQSGLGRLNGVSAIDDFVEYRTVIHEIDLGATHR